ncbi:hypothetical protein NMG60_11027535 [Bertholletia excelsa]
MESRESPAPLSQQLHSQTEQQQKQPTQQLGMTVGPPTSYIPNFHNSNSAGACASMIQSPLFAFSSGVSSDSKQMESLNSQHGDVSQPGLKPCGFSIEPAKKKRGRPRKYSPDGNIGLGLNPTSVTRVSSSVVDSSGGSPSLEPSAKRRGRPPGSGKKQLHALGSSGQGFTPHVILVNAGEDIVSKIMAFSQQGPRTVCILCANGFICKVTLRQPEMSGGTVTYEGRYEIISLSGSFSPSESDGSRSRTGGLSVSLAGSDGRVLGGGVVGMLMAATPVQVIMGSFVVDKKKPNSGPSSTPPPPQPQPSAPPPPPPNMLNFGTPVAAASRSQDPSSESSDENGSLPFSRIPIAYNSASQPVQSMSMYSNMWTGQT